MLHSQRARCHAPRKDVGAVFGHCKFAKRFLVIGAGSGQLPRAHSPDPVFGGLPELLFYDCNARALTRLEAVPPEPRNLPGARDVRRAAAAPKLMMPAF